MHVRLDKPDFASPVIANQFEIAGFVHFSGPNDFGPINIRVVVHPLIERDVRRAVADDGELVSRQICQRGLDAIPFRAEMV